jgi:hypothetical protein
MKMQGKPKKTVASENSIYQIDSRRLWKYITSITHHLSWWKKRKTK